MSVIDRRALSGSERAVLAAAAEHERRAALLRRENRLLRRELERLLQGFVLFVPLLERQPCGLCGVQTTRGLCAEHAWAAEEAS